MCMGAIQTARIKKVVFGAYASQMHGDGNSNSISETSKSNDSVATSKFTMGSSKYSPAVSIIGGVLEAEAVTLLKRFFKRRRAEI